MASKKAKPDDSVSKEKSAPAPSEEARAGKKQAAAKAKDAPAEPAKNTAHKKEKAAKAEPEKQAEPAPADSAKEPKKKKAAGLSKTQAETLKALEAAYSAPLDRRVSDVVYEARVLEDVLEKLGAELCEKSMLTPGQCGELAERRRLLEAAEDVWSRARTTRMSDDQKALRKEAEQLKRDMMEALRYFLRKDKNGESIERRLDAIAEGSGLIDLIGDLRQLSGMVDEFAAALVKADLPKKASARALVLSDGLHSSSALSSADDEAAIAIDMRNRAFWWLRELLDEVRAAGRYVYRDHPKKLLLFRQVQRRRAKPKAANTPETQ